jgi:hypothetical protein
MSPNSKGSTCTFPPEHGEKFGGDRQVLIEEIKRPVITIIFFIKILFIKCRPLKFKAHVLLGIHIFHIVVWPVTN